VKKWGPNDNIICYKFILIVLSQSGIISKNLWERQVRALKARGSRRRRGGEMWGGSVPLPTGGGVWGGGYAHSAEKIFNLGS